MGSWGGWNKRKRHLRRILSAIDAPEEVMWAAYEPSFSWPSWDGEEFREHIRSLYEGMRAAVVQEGLTDEGIVGGRDMPDQVVWGKQAQARIDEIAERPDPETSARWPWGNLVWANPGRSTTVLVNSDWDGQIPWHVLAWGDHAEACIAALEGVLETEGWWC